jgi:hypothetical protein
MTRIEFNNFQSYQTLPDPVPTNKDRGVRVHSAFEAAIWNFFAIFNFCSTVFKYTVGPETLYINRASFNHWLERHTIATVSKDDCEQLNTIEDVITRALMIKPKANNADEVKLGEDKKTTVVENKDKKSDASDAF